MNSVAWHPRNERMFASCSDDHTVRIWESPALSSSTVGRDRLGGRLMSLGGEGGIGAGSRNGLSNGAGGVSNGKGKGVVRQSWDGHGVSSVTGSGSGSAS